MSTKKKISFAALIAIPLLFGSYLLLREKPSEATVFTVKRGEVESTVTATTTGTVKARAISKISAQYAGRIERIFKREGERVKRGDIILQLENKDAMAQVSLAQANLKAAQAELSQLLISKNVVVSQVSALVSEAKARLDNARATFERFSFLYSRGMISNQELDNAKSSLDVAVADHDNARASELQGRMKDEEIKVAAARIDQMRSNLELAEVELSRTFITVPYSGIITDLYVEEGELLTAGRTVCELADESEMEVEAAIDEVDAGRVRLGQDVRLSFDAIKGKVFKGRIKDISPLVTTTKEQNRTVDIKIRITSGQEGIKVGMSTDVEVVTGVTRGVLYIPTNSIIERADGQFALVVENGVLRERVIRTGLSNWDTTEVVEGLREGDEVLTSLDIEGLRDGMRIKVMKKE